MRMLLNGVFLALLAMPVMAQAPSPAQAPPRTAPPASPQTPPAATSPQAAPAARPPAATPAAPTTAAGKVDLNLATVAELEALPGIGPARAAAIVANRPYRSPEEVVAKASVPQSVLAGMRDRVTAVQVNVNAAMKKEMIDTLPGIGDARADAIIRARPYARPEELVSKGGVPQAVFDRIKAAVALR